MKVEQPRVVKMVKGSWWVEDSKEQTDAKSERYGLDYPRRRQSGRVKAVRATWLSIEDKR